jgi:hypothetical protein
MKSITLLAILLFISTNIVNAQVEKGYWLTGGSASYDKTTSSVQDKTDRVINLDVDAGYFFIDKLAAGLRLGLTNEKAVITTTSKQAVYGGGPFVRYYFLPNGQRFNFLVDGDVQFRWANLNGTKLDGHRTIYGIGGGPVLFLNDVVAVELLGHYSHSSFTNTTEVLNNIRISLGLQIHLTQ